MTFREYDSIEDAFADMKRNEDAANEKLTDWNRQVGWGSYYMRPCPEIPCIVFGYIYTEDESREAEERCGADPEELAYTMQTMREAHDRGYRYGKHYSVVEPEGEFGSVHIANAWPISQEEFEIAKAQGWILDREQYLVYVNRFTNQGGSVSE